MHNKNSWSTWVKVKMHSKHAGITLWMASSTWAVLLTRGTQIRLEDTQNREGSTLQLWFKSSLSPAQWSSNHGLSLSGGSYYFGAMKVSLATVDTRRSRMPSLSSDRCSRTWGAVTKQRRGFLFSTGSGFSLFCHMVMKSCHFLPCVCESQVQKD